MKLSRSSSLRKSSPNHETRPSDSHQSSSPTAHRHLLASPATSVSSNSTQSPLTPTQCTFPTYGSIYHHQSPQSPSRAPSTCTYPFSESKSRIHARSISRIRNCLSISGSANHPFKLQPTPLHHVHHKSPLPLSHNQLPTPASDQSRPRRSSILSSNRARSSTVSNPGLSDAAPARPPITSLSNSHQPLPKLNRPQPLYGVIKKSFKAERRYELNVQAGESVIINAYNDQGWFVCKPICRLGGPGLVPILHVQICDMLSGRQLSSEDVLQSLRSSGLPQAEEWRQSAAAYKCNSIPLGSLESLTLSTPSDPSSTKIIVPELPERLRGLDTIDKNAKQDAAQSSELVREWQLQQAAEESPIHIPERVEKMSHTPTRYGTLLRSTAESFLEEGGQPLFLIKVHFFSPDDSEKYIKTFIIHRNYKELLAFDASFRLRLRTFPDSSVERLCLPNLTDQVSVDMPDQRPCFNQFENLQCYLSTLAVAPLAIRQLREVFDFLAPSKAHRDFETLMAEAMDEEVIQYLNETHIVPTPQELLNFCPPIHNRPRSSSSDQRNSSPLASDPSHGRRSSGPISDHSSNHLSSDYLSATKPRSSSYRFVNNRTKSYYQLDGEYTKIKVYDLQSDDVVALKVSSKIRLEELSAKIAERLQCSSPTSNFSDDIVPRRGLILKHLVIDPADEMDTDFIDLSGDELEFASPRLPGKLTKFSSDEHLWHWMLTEERLVIYI